MKHYLVLTTGKTYSSTSLATLKAHRAGLWDICSPGIIGSEIIHAESAAEARRTFLDGNRFALPAWDSKVAVA